METCATAQKTVICISGMAGTGKSTLSKKLAEKYHLKYYSGGDALKALAVEEGIDASKPGWWESSAGLHFLERRKKNPEFDKCVDENFLKIAKEGDVIFDSWAMPWLVEGGFKIWLESSLQKRAERVAKRDGITTQEALKALAAKEEKSKAVYKNLYGFRLGEDFAPFNLILDTDNLNADEVFEVLCTVMDKTVLHK